MVFTDGMDSTLLDPIKNGLKQMIYCNIKLEADGSLLNCLFYVKPCGGRQNELLTYLVS
jgi:hypothetical protein